MPLEERKRAQEAGKGDTSMDDKVLAAQTNTKSTKGGETIAGRRRSPDRRASQEREKKKENSEGRARNEGADASGLATKLIVRPGAAEAQLLKKRSTFEDEKMQPKEKG